MINGLIGNAIISGVKNCRLYMDIHFMIHVSVHPGMKDLLKELKGDEPVDTGLHKIKMSRLQKIKVLIQLRWLFILTSYILVFQALPTEIRSL